MVDFLRRAFDATETYRTTGDAGGSHVELQIGDARLMLGGGNGTVEQPTQSAMFLYVEDVDAVYQSALEAGATSIIEPQDGMFQEERGAGVARSGWQRLVHRSLRAGERTRIGDQNKP